MRWLVIGFGVGVVCLLLLFLTRPDVFGLRKTEQVTGPEAALYHPVAKVVDGDTIDVDLPEGKQRVRLMGINTPETVDKRRPIQCFGREASHYMKELLRHRRVKLEPDPKEDRDKYGRLLRYVYLADGTFVNRQLVSEGYAEEYTYQGQSYQYQAEFKRAEGEAKAAGRGLWSRATCNGDTKKAAFTPRQLVATRTVLAQGPSLYATA